MHNNPLNSLPTQSKQANWVQHQNQEKVSQTARATLWSPEEDQEKCGSQRDSKNNSMIEVMAVIEQLAQRDKMDEIKKQDIVYHLNKDT